MFLRMIGYTLLRNFRDRNGMLSQLFLPLAFILILGYALSGAGSPDVERVSVGVVSGGASGSGGEQRGAVLSGPAESDEDEPGAAPSAGSEPAGGRADSAGFSYAAHLLEFLDGEEVADYVAPEPVRDLDEALRLMRDGEIAAAVVLPADFDRSVAEGRTVEIELIRDPERGFAVATVQTVLEGYLSGLNAVRAVIEVTGAGFEFEMSPGGRSGAAAGDEPENARATVRRMPVDSERSEAGGAIDYYAVTMLVMFLVFGALYASYGLHEQYLRNAGLRIRCAPVRRLSSVAGTTAASAVTVVVSGLFIIGATALLFGVDWGSRPGFLLLMLAAHAAFVTAFGVFVLGVFRNDQRSEIAISIVAQVGAFVAGGLIRFAGDTPFLDTVAMFFPHRYAQEGIFTAIHGGPASIIYLNAFILTISAVVLLLAGVGLLSPRRIL